MPWECDGDEADRVVMHCSFSIFVCTGFLSSTDWGQEPSIEVNELWETKSPSVPIPEEAHSGGRAEQLSMGSAKAQVNW